MNKEREDIFFGFCSVGLEPVLKLWKAYFNKYDIGSSLCIYMKGKLLMKVWGGFKNKEKDQVWEEFIKTPVYSVSKAVTNLSILLLIDRGYIDFDTKIASIWPEFGVNGKSDITISELLSHRAGICYLDDKISYQQIQDSLSMNKDFSHFLARQKPNWKINRDFYEFGYSPRVSGFYINEIIKRVDPKHRNVRQFFNDEIANPFNIDFQYGTNNHSNVAYLHRLSFNDIQKFIKPNSQDRKEFVSSYKDENTLTYKAFNCYHFDYDVNNPDVQKLLVPSSMGITTSDAIAKIFGIYANGGVYVTRNQNETSSITLISKNTVQRSIEKVVEGKDKTLLNYSTFSRGGLMLEPSYDSAFFHAGTGGSFGWGDIKLGLSIGYCTNALDISSIVDDRRNMLVKSIYQCLNRIQDIEKLTLYDINKRPKL